MQKLRVTWLSLATGQSASYTTVFFAWYIMYQVRRTTCSKTRKAKKCSRKHLMFSPMKILKKALRVRIAKRDTTVIWTSESLHTFFPDQGNMLFRGRTVLNYIYLGIIVGFFLVSIKGRHPTNWVCKLIYQNTNPYSFYFISSYLFTSDKNNTT